MEYRFDKLVDVIISEQLKANPLASTMGNPGYAGSMTKPNMANFTGFSGSQSNSDPSSSADPDSPSPASSQFASKMMGAGGNYEQQANQFLGMAINDLDKIVNMRDATSAARTVRSVYSQLDPTGAEALAKSLEQPGFKWDDFKSVLKKKISQLGNVAGSFVG